MVEAATTSRLYRPAESTQTQVLATVHLAGGPLSAAEIARAVWPAWARDFPADVTARVRDVLLHLVLARRLVETVDEQGETRYAKPRADAIASGEQTTASSGLGGERSADMIVSGGEPGAIAGLENQETEDMAATKEKRKPKSKIQNPKREPEQGKADPAASGNGAAKGATARRPAGGGRSKTFAVAVHYGGVSIGQGTARVGIHIDRQELTLAQADQYLCGRRLSGRIVVQPAGEDARQKHLVDDLRHELAGTFDVKRVGVSPDTFTAGLTFSTEAIDLAELGHFAKARGTLYVQDVAALLDGEGTAGPEDEEDDGEEDDD